MPYFTAVLARAKGRWLPRAIDVDDAEDLDTLAERLRGAAVEDELVLLLLEHEDEWFAVVRVDGDDDPRVFVSELGAAARSPYGETLGLAGEAEDEEDLSLAEGPSGDLDVLADLGTTAERLRDLCVEGKLLTSDALAALAADAGFEDVLDAMR